MEFYRINIIYVALSIRAQTEKTTFSYKDNCTLKKHTRRWTYSALPYTAVAVIFITANEKRMDFLLVLSFKCNHG